jgi:hypothetical protein
MTRLEAIETIGDVLTRLDVLRGSLPISDPVRLRLDDARLMLDDRQRRLARSQFDEGTAGFKATTAQLSTIITGMRADLASLERTVQTIAGVKRIVGAVDKLLSIAVPFA